MRKIQCIIKVTNGCNLRCKYCYNAGKHFKNEIISLDKMEKLFSVLAEFDCIQVIFHGGEPMLGGMEFYEKVLELEKHFTYTNGVEFENEIQTNATLINSRWLSFFKKNKIAVGISYDGIYNEEYRGGTDKVLKAIQLLKKQGIPFGSGAVIADPNYNLIENYEHFKSLGMPVNFGYVAVEGSAKELGGVLDNDEYIKQSIALFDHWLHDKEGISVRNNEFMVRKALKCDYEYCTNGSCVGNFFCLDVDGSLYGCSMESAKQFCFGNISEFSSFHDVINSARFKEYVKGSIARRKVCQSTCEYFDYCKGGCNDDAITNGDITKPNKAYCKYFGTLFAHIKNTIDEIYKNKVDLSTLNPHFAKALMQTMVVDEKGSI